MAVVAATARSATILRGAMRSDETQIRRTDSRPGWGNGASVMKTTLNDLSRAILVMTAASAVMINPSRGWAAVSDQL